MIPVTDVMTYTDIFYFLFHCDLLLRFISEIFFYASHLFFHTSLINYSHVCLYVLCLSLEMCVGFHLCHFCHTNCLPIILTILNLPNLFFIIPTWIPCFLIIISNDVHVNPGPNNINNNIFSFCNWNCNSLAKDNFNRVDLLKVQASIYNYDIIGLCETLLNDNVEIPESLIEGYNFEPLNHSSGTKRGGVGIFYKNSLPLKIRKDISFDECLVCEIHIGKRKVFYTVCYRSPSMKANTPEFEFFYLILKISIPIF